MNTAYKVGLNPGVKPVVKNPGTFFKAVAESKNSAKKVEDLSNVGFFTGLENLFTGNLDYKRSIESATRAERHSALEAARAREWSAEQARILREWQAEMSNTAYSRAVADLRSVGINPYAVGFFKAASTPTGAYGQSFAGNAYTGNVYRSGEGFKILADILQTLIKEYGANKRSGDINAVRSLLLLNKK